MDSQPKNCTVKVTVLEPDTRLQFWPHPPPPGAVHGWIWFIRKHPAADIWKRLNVYDCYQKRQFPGG